MPNPLSLLIRALLLGISSGASHCFIFCLPVILPPLLGLKQSGIKGAAKNLSLFLLGRLIAYLSLGVTLGILSKELRGSYSFHTAILPFLYLFLGLLLILYGTVNINPFARLALCRFVRPATNSGWFLWTLGLLVGLSPCPPFLLAITTVLEQGGLFNGLLFFLFFFLTTTLFFLPLLFTGFLTHLNEFRLAGRIVSILTGGYFILLTFKFLPI